jgi:lipopolysaccharide/colanic/teichoic acid biosynthesis glycosyltransferase
MVSMRSKAPPPHSARKARAGLPEPRPASSAPAVAPSHPPLSLEAVAEALAGLAGPPDPLPVRVVRRTLDISVSLLVLILSSPLMMITALVIAVDSRGPVFFRQRRVTLGGREFTFFKFRTMHADAAQRFPHLYTYSYDEGQLSSFYFKLAEDPRLTRFGRYLRRTSLDELPNFINVLTGSITLVGPRPEIPEMLGNYRPEQLVKFSVKPGITGLSQTRGRNILTFQQTVGFDLEYVHRRSLRYDLRILARTPVTVLRMLGAL